MPCRLMSKSRAGSKEHRETCAHAQPVDLMWENLQRSHRMPTLSPENVLCQKDWWTTCIVPFRHFSAGYHINFVLRLVVWVGMGGVFSRVLAHFPILFLWGAVMMNTEHIQRQPRRVLIIHSEEPLVEFLELGLRYEGFHVEAIDHPVWACHPHSSSSISSGLIPKISVSACLVVRLEQHWQENTLADELEAIWLDWAYVF